MPKTEPLQINILTIIGARPQFIKAAALSRTIREQYPDFIKEMIVHTGQHYDSNMSQVFFDELNIPRPDYQLEVGSLSHARQTAEMLVKLEEVCLTVAPDYVLVYGDTNSTLAGAVVASKLNIPLIHVEAGLRSFNQQMPEEINRIICDRVSSLLLAPTETAVKNLKREGFTRMGVYPFSPDHPSVFHCGDIMYDSSLLFSEVSEKHAGILRKLDLRGKKFALATVHRNFNTDQPERLKSILEALVEARMRLGLDVVIPMHPRTLKNLKYLEKSFVRSLQEELQILPPVSYLEMLQLEQHAELIFTDSGGVQKEAYFFEKACVILRPETEWMELLEQKTAKLADASVDQIVEAADHFIKNPPTEFPAVFGKGDTAKTICEILIQNTPG